MFDLQPVTIGTSGLGKRPEADLALATAILTSPFLQADTSNNYADGESEREQARGDMATRHENSGEAVATLAGARAVEASDAAPDHPGHFQRLHSRSGAWRGGARRPYRPSLIDRSPAGEHGLDQSEMPQCAVHSL